MLALLPASRVSEVTNLRVDYWTNIPKTCETPVWSFTTSQVTTIRQLMPILKGGEGGGRGLESWRSQFLVRHIKPCLMGWRSQFLVRHIKPHKPMPPSTASRWLGQVLAMTDINTEVFKTHSTLSASSSKAKVTGVFLTDIIKQGIWSQASTFQKSYRKSIREHDSNFQSWILNKQLLRE